MPKVQINGHEVNLTKSDVLAQGGEALIYSYGSEVIKLYHTPTPERERKLLDFWRLNPRLPQNVRVPVNPVNDRTGRVIGFTMPPIPDGYEPVILLGKNDFCKSYSLDARKIVDTFLEYCRDLHAIHPTGFVVGDLNDKNEYFHPKTLATSWIDVDSWQFGPHPCVVGTEPYLSPDLYGVDLTVRPMFKPWHDWYSFSVLLFIALMRSHPFSGFNRQWQSITTRAANRLTIFDADVRYPKAALPPDILTDEMKDLLLGYLKRQRTDPFPLDQLANYAELLVECKQCGIWYPVKNRQCPGCATKTILDAAMAAKVAGYVFEELFVSNGSVLHAKIIGDAVYAVANENDQAVLYVKKPQEAVQKIPLFGHRPGARYEIFEDMVVVCPDPTVDSTPLYAIDFSSGTPQGAFQSSTELYAGGRAVYATSQKYLYRIAGSVVLQGERFGSRLVERQVCEAIPGQTWFAVSPNPSPDQEVVFGFYRNFDKMRWFVVNSQNETKVFNRHEVKLAELNTGESMIDLSVKFHFSKILVMRKIRLHGRDSVLVEIVSAKNGAVETSYRVDINSVREFESIQGKAFVQGSIFHPTDDGVVRETVTTQDRTIMASTGSYVNTGDFLHPYGNGLLIIKGDRLCWLRKS